MSFSLYLGYLEIRDELEKYCRYNTRIMIKYYVEVYLTAIVTENVRNNVQSLIPIQEQMNLEIPSKTQLNNAYKVLESL